MRVHTMPHVMEKFADRVHQPDFKEDLRLARDNPNSRKARPLAKEVAPMVHLASGDTAFSPSETSAALSKMCGMVARHGTPSVFLTIAPDDMKNPLVLRFGFPSKSGANKFPEDGAALLEALRGDMKTFGSVPIDPRSLARAAALNPAGSALLYKKIIHVLVTVLLGTKPSATLRKSASPYATPGGALGRAFAYFYVTEQQTRGTNHAHMLL